MGSPPSTGEIPSKIFKMKFPLPFCILFQICFFVVSSHRHGAPNKSCHKMIPHHKHLKLDGQGAYLKINQTDANQLELTLATTNDKSFKGVAKEEVVASLMSFMIYFHFRF